MARLTDDPNDPELTHGVDKEPTPQANAYLVLPAKEREKGFVRPVRTMYKHSPCGGVTTMSTALAETYAAKPDFYGATYCVHCVRHCPVSEFTWVTDGTQVGS